MVGGGAEKGQDVGALSSHIAPGASSHCGAGAACCQSQAIPCWTPWPCPHLCEWSLQLFWVQPSQETLFLPDLTAYLSAL